MRVLGSLAASYPSFHHTEYLACCRCPFTIGYTLLSHDDKGEVCFNLTAVTLLPYPDTRGTGHQQVSLSVW